MKKTIPLFASIFILNINAQETEKTNIIKTNVTAYVFRNINLTYEKSFNRWFSVNVGFGIVPEGKTPFENYFLDKTNRDKVDNLQIKSSNYTLESRFYIGKGYGKGFYIAPYYRYSKVTSNTFDFVYDYQVTNNFSVAIPLKGFGDTHGNSGGVMVGTQLFLTKSQNLVLDFWIAGAHYGAGNGNFDLTTDQTLTPDMQAKLKQEIDDLNVSFIKYTTTTNPHGAHVDVSGPWAGFRSGISLGFRF